MHLTVPQKLTAINWRSLLLWSAITLLFLYERTYLIQKAGLPHLIECVVVLVVLLVGLCHLHNNVLVPRLLVRKKYILYGLLIALSVGVYLLIQGLYDQYLFGFVIGDRERAGLWQNLPYNLIVTGWYVLLTYLVNRATSPKDHSEMVALDSTLPPVTNEVLTIKTGTQWIHLPASQVLYAQGLKDYTMLYTENERHIVKGSIGKVADWLPITQFIRVHKSYLVAKQHIKSLSGTEITVNGRAIPVGRSYAKDVLDEFLVNGKQPVAPIH